MTDTRTALIEAMAQGMFIQNFGMLPYLNLHRDPMAAYTIEATAALDALSSKLAELGLCVVPVEATEHMLGEANRLNHPRDHEIYDAMIAAAPNPLEEK